MSTTPKMSDVINKCAIYDLGDQTYGQYQKAVAQYESDMSEYAAYGETDSDMTEPTAPAISEPLKGLRIITVKVSEPSRMTNSPIETGVEMADCKIRMPKRIDVTGICDNMRSEITVAGDYDKYGNSSSIGATIKSASFGILGSVGDLLDRLIPHSITTSQTIETVAKTVYSNINKMLEEGEYGEGNSIKTYSIMSKGKVYDNMILTNVEQMNDAEHLMVIPVTLTFDELMVADQTESQKTVLDDQNSSLQFNGSSQKGSILSGIAYYLAQLTGVDISGIVS